METDQGMAPRGINFAVVDHDFVEALGIKIATGRDFQQDMPSDTLTSVVVNATLADRMGWRNPIGKKVELGDGSQLLARVIGVMKNYYQTGMYNEIESLMLVYRESNYMIYVKLGENYTDQTLSFIEEKWKVVFPGHPFNYGFLSERFNRQFEADEKRGLIFTLFTVLAILIASLGLFGLASYMVEQRTKEIGIRKVFGASEGVIIRLISKEFLILVGISIVIASPAAYFLMNNWLENYVYRTKIGILMLVIAALLTVSLTILTIGFKAYQAAVMNPALSIRTE